MKGQVSIIIPNFNNARWLSQCLESCLIQDELLKEIIVIDDYSSDNSHEVLNEYKSNYPDKIFWYLNKDKGGNNARNYGFEKSSGEFIQWLDSDDLLLPGKFEAQISPLVSDVADIVFSDWRVDYWENGLHTKSENKYYQAYPDFLLELIKDNWTSPNNYLMTRKMAALLAGGIGWNPATKVGQDREYFTMAGILGARFQYVPGFFAVYNKQDRGTISGMDFKTRLECNQILEERFRLEIEKSKYITAPKKKEYNRVLETHTIKACFYHNGIRIRRLINPLTLKWRLMHWKMRLVIPFLVVKKNIESLFNR